MDLTIIFLFFNLFLLLLNLINISCVNLYNKFAYILIVVLIVLIDKNIHKNISKYALVTYNILSDLFIINIQLIFWVVLLNVIYYFIVLKQK